MPESGGTVTGANRAPGKRIVLRHTSGRYNGLYRIMGRTEQLTPDAAALPLYLAEVDFIDHKAPAGLVKVTTRAMVYHEIPVKETV